eukprot:336216_1
MTEPICWTVIIFVNTPITPMHNIITYLWINIVFDIFTRLILVYFFTRKFFGIFMLKQTHPNDVEESVSITYYPTDTNGEELSMVPMNTLFIQNKIFKLIKTMTLLRMISILPLILSRLALVFVFFVNDGISTHNNWTSFNALQCVGAFIEILVIVLTFGFDSYLYPCRYQYYCDLGYNKCCVLTSRSDVLSRNL